MASLEKLNRALEALNIIINSSHVPEENRTRNKEKVSGMISITDLLCAPEIRFISIPQFGFSMEKFLYLCDDADSNVRMVADECLNRLIRAYSDGNFGKITFELICEIKKNRNARSLRTALVKFAELAQTIKLRLRSGYAVNIVLSILQIAQRKEESVLETLALSLSKILLYLGRFISDMKIKEMIQVFLKNIENENAVVRRTAATSILAVCLNCSKPQFFIVHTFNTLLESTIPVKEDQNIFKILGVLNCIRGLFSHLDGTNSDIGLRGSFGLKRKEKKDYAVSVDSLIQVFELCLYWTKHDDHNVVTSALETLNELLSSLPSVLLPTLINQHGLTRTRIQSSNPNWKLSSRTLSDISVAVTPAPMMSDDSLLFEQEEFTLQPGDLTNWLDQSFSNGNQFNAHFVLEKEKPEHISDNFSDYPDSDSVMSDDLGSLLKFLPIQSSEPELNYARDSPSPPLESIHAVAWDIGELTDGSQPPLLYTARRLVTGFLIPECGSARVSVRSLALMCLTQVLRLQPTIFFQTVDKNGLSSPKGFSHVCDMILFSTDADQQLRGQARLLIGHLIYALFDMAIYEKNFYQILEKNISLESLLSTLVTGVQDESSVCVRHSLSSLSICLPIIIESNYYLLTTPILNKLLTVSQNPYWLVKVHLVELFCSFPFSCIHFMTGNNEYQSKILNIFVEEFLSSDDSRVRKTACEGIVKIVKNLYFPVDYGADDVVVARGIDLISKTFLDIFSKGENKRTLGLIVTENTLSRVIDILIELLIASSSKYLSHGCIEALYNLSEEYPPSTFPDSWNCRTNSIEEEPMTTGGIFSIVVTFITSSHLSLDLENHQWLLKLASNLCKGLFTNQLVIGKDRNNLEKSKFLVSVQKLVVHLMRLLAIFYKIVDDKPCVRRNMTSPLKKKINPRPNSPKKDAHVPGKDNEKDEKIKLVGSFENNPHCMKLYGIIRSGYLNYKTTLDKMASKKFLSLVKHALSCFETMLAQNGAVDSNKIHEELLEYMSVSFVLNPEATVRVVNELMISLFVSFPETQKKRKVSNEYFPTGYYKNIFHNPLVQLSKLSDFPDRMKSAETNEQTQPQFDRDFLATRIRLFEGIVIQSMKEYTQTCDVKFQGQALRLMTLLVQHKVNYCLLDAKQVFLQFVLKQFVFLEAGQIHDAEYLIPAIFNFLSHLTNEKDHSKPLINMPEIIQLCDGLMASGQNPVIYCIPAILPIVEHVFFKNEYITDRKDLETQKEVLLAMLLRLAEYPEVQDCIYKLLKDRNKEEEHWSRLYKQTIDTITLLLSEGRPIIININSLHSLFYLNKSFVNPLSSVLILLFSPQQEGQAFSQWLGMVTVTLLSLCLYQECQVLKQLEEMNLYVREEGDDPLKVNTVSKTLPPQSLLAKLLFRVIVKSVSKLSNLIHSQLKDENIFELEKTFAKFLLCCVYMFQPDNFIEVSRSLSILLNESADLNNIISEFELVMNHCQLPILLWAQIMKLLHHSNRNSWNPFIRCSGKANHSLNYELIRRGSIMLYADYLAKNPNDIDSLQWLLSNYIEDIICHCHEPPIENLLTSIYNLESNNKILFQAITKCINTKVPVFSYKLLHTLEYIHSDYSGSVLKLVALSLINYKNIALARLAAAFCCRTIEFILTSESASNLIKEQLTEEDLRLIFENLASDQKLFKRHNGLIILLNKFGKHCYKISLTEIDCVKPVSANFVRSVKLDNDWFFNLTKEKCCSLSETNTQRCAYLLSKLQPTDLEKIMCNNNFNVDILQHCFLLYHNQSHKLSDEKKSIITSSYAFFDNSKKILLKLIKNICGKLPSEYQVFIPQKQQEHRLHNFLRSQEFMKYFYSLFPAVTNLFLNLKEFSFDLKDIFEKEDVDNLARVGVFCMEVMNWLLYQEKSGLGKHRPSTLQDILKCSSLIFQIDLFAVSLTLEHIYSICNALLNAFTFILGEDLASKQLIPQLNDGQITSEIPLIGEIAVSMVSLISIIEKKPNNVPVIMFRNIKSIVISLGRDAKLNWLCRLPIEAWQPPLDSSTPPTLPTEILHDAEILERIVSRIHLLGWRGKFQFEESWVCLLSALSPNPDYENTEPEEIAVMMQANSLAIDGISWLAISTLSNHNNSIKELNYLHIPRHHNEKLANLKYWKKLSEMNDTLCKKLKIVSQNYGIHHLRLDERPNLERTNNPKCYGFGQISVSYLENQIKCIEEEEGATNNLSISNEYGEPKAGIDTRSCIQFILDLFHQWILPGSEISLNLQFSMVKSLLFISDMFMERSHFEWMLDTFLQIAKNHPSHDDIILQYLVIGIAKCCAVLNYFEGEISDEVFKSIESALKSSYVPLVESGLHGLLYLLQAVNKIEKPAENIDIPKLKQQEFRQKVVNCSIEVIDKHLRKKWDPNESTSLLILALVFYILEYYPDEVKSNKQDLINILISIAKSATEPQLYLTIVQGLERLILLDQSFNHQITRLALNMYSRPDPQIAIPALQLLLACIYADGNESSEDADSQKMELMEKVTTLFDRIKKGYPFEVEIVCSVLPRILADFFSASDILTKAISEFLSPNQPHKGNMAGVVFKVFSQACSEQQLSLLQDWVVYSLNNLTHNIPVMMAVWSLSCFFISASTNPWLKAIFPIVQSRIRQCDYEDRQILCLAAFDFYQQLNKRQQQKFLESLKNIGSSCNSPFYNILLCL